MALDVMGKDKSWVAALRAIIESDVSPAARASLELLLRFLREVVAQEESNRMSAANIAMVFGPCILRCEDDTPDYLYLLPKINTVAAAMLTHQDLLFAK